MKSPRLILLEPEKAENGLADFGKSSFIYSKSILYRSFLCLKNKSVLATIQDTRQLIEQVYGSLETPGLTEMLTQYLEEARSREMEKATQIEFKARSMLVESAQSPRLLYKGILNLKDEDDPEIHQSYRALTRDSGLSISLICMHRGVDGRLYLEPTCGGKPVSLENLEKRPADIVALLKRAVNISHAGLVFALLQDEHAQRIEGPAALRNCRLAVFEDGVYLCGKYVLRLDKRIGLHIEKRV